MAQGMTTVWCTCGIYTQDKYFRFSFSSSSFSRASLPAIHLRSTQLWCRRRRRH
jgi:hypothetical protein